MKTVPWVNSSGIYPIPAKTTLAETGAARHRTPVRDIIPTMDNPYYHRVAITLERAEGEPINGDEMFVARCEHFPELAMAESSP